MKLTFYTPSHGVTENFGAATFGFVGAEDENACRAVDFSRDIRGVLLTGSYEECLRHIPAGDFKAGIVVLGNAGGENAFIRRLYQAVNVPLTGGGAAIHPQTGEKGLITGKNEAAVFLIDDNRYTIEVLHENIHHDILSEHDISFTDPRVLDTVDGVEARTWLRDKKASLGLPETDFEHLTFSDTNGVNAHLSLAEGRIASGCDLAPRMQLRYLPATKVNERMQAFYNDADAITFGCAGLKGILTDNLHTDGLGLFLFGEVCTTEHGAEFGNLMLSKLRVLPNNKQ